jgi:hypothetical protein
MLPYSLLLNDNILVSKYKRKRYLKARIKIICSFLIHLTFALLLSSALNRLAFFPYSGAATFIQSHFPPVVPPPLTSSCNRVLHSSLLNSTFHIEINKGSGRFFTLFRERFSDFYENYFPFWISSKNTKSIVLINYREVA